MSIEELEIEINSIGVEIDNLRDRRKARQKELLVLKSKKYIKTYNISLDNVMIIDKEIQNEMSRIASVDEWLSRNCSKPFFALGDDVYCTASVIRAPCYTLPACRYQDIPGANLETA